MYLLRSRTKVAPAPLRMMRLILSILAAASPSFAQYHCTNMPGKTCSITVQTVAADLGADINAAIQACPESGCLIEVPPGNYRLNATVPAPCPVNPVYAAVCMDKPVRLHLGAGTYTAGVFSKVQQVIMLAAHGAVLEGDGPATIIQTTDAAIGVDIPSTGSGSILRNLTLKGACVLNGVHCNSTQIPAEGVNAGSAMDVTITDVVVENWGNHGINTGGFSTGWRIARVTTQSNFNDGILLAQNSNHAAVDAVTAQYNGGNGIDINAAYASITNNISAENGYNNAGRGVDCWGILVASVAGTNVNADANAITGNRVFNNYCHQIVIRAEDPAYHSSWNEIKGNDISGGANTRTYQNATGIVIDASIPNGGTIEGTLIADNVITGMPNDGVLIGGGAGQGTQRNNTIRHNRLLSNGQAGSGYGIELSSGSNTKLDQNTFVANVTGKVKIGGSASHTQLKE